MTSCDFNDQEFNNNFNVFDNNSHLFEQFCEKKLKIDEINRRQETAIKDVFFKDNNASYSTISFRDTNKFSSDSFIYGVTESDSKILLNKNFLSLHFRVSSTFSTKRERNSCASH